MRLTQCAGFFDEMPAVAVGVVPPMHAGLYSATCVSEFALDPARAQIQSPGQIVGIQYPGCTADDVNQIRGDTVSHLRGPGGGP